MLDGSYNESNRFWSAAKRQFALTSAILALLGLVVLVLFLKDRQREWRLRQEQAGHRLELAYELFARDLQRVTSDVLFLATQPSVSGFEQTDSLAREKCEQLFSDFLLSKGTYQQIRLINREGVEVLRVDFDRSGTMVVEQDQLQDKKDRYYVREGLKLNPGELFLSEFDLNVEHAEIEQPLNPVIRFATPLQPGASVENDDNRLLLVANYRGAPLLADLGGISLPGKTFLIRNDGEFLLGADPDDAWGWLLGHDRSFDNRFPDAWPGWESGECRLLDSGAFAFRKLNSPEGDAGGSNNQLQRDLLIVSWLPRQEVYASSRQTLFRLLLLIAATAIPILLLTRAWADSSFRRESQNARVRESEQKLRELSQRLVRVQEEERQSISREIHDQLGQQATAISLDLKLALREQVNSDVRRQLERAVSETGQLLDRLHDFASRVRPVELDDLGLIDALEGHLQEFSDRTGVQCRLVENVRTVSLPAEVSENTFRLVQESLNNVLKHADATSVEVTIEGCGENATGFERLCVRVQDDGIGLRQHGVAENGVPNGAKRLGVLGMQERVELLKGSFEISSRPGEGTTVIAEFPIRPAEQRS